MSRAVLLSTCVAIAACALPRSEIKQQSFVPENEIRAVSLVNEGIYNFSRGRMIDAELKLRQAHYLFPDREKITRNLALVISRNGQGEEARQHYEVMIKAGETIDLLGELAQVYFNESDYERAVDIYRRALTAAGEAGDLGRLAQTARSLSTLNFHIGQEQEALCHSYLAFAAQADKEQLMRHTKLLIAMGMPGVAKNLLIQWAKALELRNEPEIRYLLALSSFGNGEYAEAKRAAELVIGLRGTEGKFEFGLNLLREVAVAKSAMTEDLEESKESEAESEESAVEIAQIDGPLAIYLPANLLEAVAELKANAEEVKADGES